MIAKIRITTEEEAKAAIAERRRLAREQAEREAELERQRQVRFLTASLHVKAAALSAKRGDRLIWVNHFAGDIPVSFLILPFLHCCTRA